MSTQMDPKYIAKLAVILMVISAIVAALLGVVNQVTYERIEKAKAEKTQTSLQTLFPGAQFTELELSDEMKAAASGDVTQSKLYSVYEASSGGWAIEVGPTGYSGTIDMIVGIDAEGKVTGLSVVSNTETAGIGTKVCTNKPNKDGEPVLDQFIGRAATAEDLFLVGGTGANGISAISGATVTTKAVTRGVNAASLVYALLG